MSDDTNRLEHALAAYEAGDRAEARRAAEEALAVEGAHGDANNLLSVIAQDEGRQSDAEAFARAALDADGSNPIYLNTLANALLRQGRTDGAIEAFEQARRLIPDQPDILFNLGNALREAGRYVEAIDAFRASLAIRPGIVAAYNNLAITLRAMGESESAATVLIEGLAFAPKSPELRFNLGNALQASGRFEAAESAYRRAVDLAPDHADAWVNLGVVLSELNRKADAEQSFRQAIAIEPDLSQAYVGLADLADDGSLDAVAHRRSVLALRPDLAAIRSSLLMCMHYTPEASLDDLYTEHVGFGDHHNQDGPPAFAKDMEFTPDKPLRLGVVSGDIRFHAMAFLCLPVFAKRPRDEWSLYCYSTTARPDGHTAAFHQIVDRWRDVRALSDEALATLIAQDRIDILIDLSGHAPHNRLAMFASRPAPLQVAWGDYVNTRGLAAIDALVGDHVHIPEGDESRYVESILRMPSDYICYSPPDYLPPVAPVPASKTGTVTFGTFSELTKIQPETVALWSTVLRANPQSRFFANSYLFADEARQGRLYTQFQENGIGTDRIIIGTGGDHSTFLNQYSEVDVILDTWPYSGGLTTCEALVMGVPVVALKGDRFCGRHATAHLTAAGFSDWVALDPDSYVEVASDLASDIEKLSERRRHQRKTVLASPLCDVTNFSENFYALLRDAWA